jgi:hypothetical protein
MNHHGAFLAGALCQLDGIGDGALAVDLRLDPVVQLAACFAEIITEQGF